MKKSEAVVIGKVLAETCLKKYIKKHDLSNNLLDNEIDVVGLKEYEDKKVCKILFKLQKLDTVICEIVCNMETKHCNTNIFSKVETKRGKKS